MPYRAIICTQVCFYTFDVSITKISLHYPQKHGHAEGLKNSFCVILSIFRGQKAKNMKILMTVQIFCSIFIF